MVRLEWVHAKAALDRWKEEGLLLREESRRVVESFLKKSESFMAMKNRYNDRKLPERVQRGYHSYLYRQAWEFNELADFAKKQYSQVIGCHTQ